MYAYLIQKFGRCQVRNTQGHLYPPIDSDKIFSFSPLFLYPKQAEKIRQNTEKLFSNPTKMLYCGYVDDPRNTDNAWMETCCTLFHDATGQLTQSLRLEAGDDAKAVQWMEINLEDPQFKLYASHRDFIKLAYDYIRQHDVENFSSSEMS